ncbi:MAG: DUF4138 domain-containing protein [Bacteroidota bacterium]
MMPNTIRHILYLATLVLMLMGNLSAQSTRLDIPYDKTLVLIFPSPIEKHVLSTEDIGMRIEGSHCYLQADLEDFPEASLFIQLSNQAYYSFVLNYNNETEVLVKALSLEEAAGIADPEEIQPLISDASSARLFEPEFTQVENTSEEELRHIAREVLSKHDIKTVGIQSGKIALTLDGIYAAEDMLFLKVSLHNRSNISYEVEWVKFFLTGKRKSLKRTAIQDEEKFPLFILNESTSQVGAKSQLSRVYAFRQFSLSKDFAFQIDIIEKEGKRDLSLVVDSGVWGKAKGM